MLHEVDGLSDDGLTASSRVPERDEHDVAGEERDGREPSPSMPDRETVEPDRAFEPSDSRHEQQLDQHDVRAEEPRELTDCRCDATRSAERVEATVAEPQPDDHDGVGSDDGPDVASPIVVQLRARRRGCLRPK